MNTTKLYYEDSHLKAFTATVTGCAPAKKGWEVTLDATAFYPEGGGQACDLGTLGGTIGIGCISDSDPQPLHKLRQGPRERLELLPLLHSGGGEGF